MGIFLSLLDKRDRTTFPPVQSAPSKILTRLSSSTATTFSLPSLSPSRSGSSIPPFKKI